MKHLQLFSQHPFEVGKYCSYYFTAVLHGRWHTAVLPTQNKHQSSKTESDAKGPDTFIVVYICILVFELPELTFSCFLDSAEY